MPAAASCLRAFVLENSLVDCMYFITNHFHFSLILQMGLYIVFFAVDVKLMCLDRLCLNFISGVKRKVLQKICYKKGL